jgi:hypothetical protein
MVKIKNNCKGILVSGISDSDTTITLLSGQGDNFPETPESEDFFRVTIVSQIDSDVFEVVKVNYRNGDIFFIERGQEGTTPLPFSSGDNVELRITTQTLLDLIYVDTSKYDLESVYVAVGDNHTNIKTVTSLIVNEKSGRTKIFSKDFNKVLPKSIYDNYLYGKPPKIYFRLRDKTTGRVGRPSSFYVSALSSVKVNGRAAFGFYIGSDKIR